MRKYKPLFSLAVFALGLLPATGYSAAALSEPARLSPLELQQIIPDLRRGGYVIYFRHMSSNLAQEDQRPVDLTNCQTQRNLTAQGRQQAEALGKAFRQLKLPITDVISSPFCRCKDTARLAFGKFTTSDTLYFAMGLTRAGKQAKGKTLREMLTKPPTKGHNRIIISHSANLQEAVGLWPKPEGVAYLFKPDGKGQFKAIGKVDPASWSQAN